MVDRCGTLATASSKAPLLKDTGVLGCCTGCASSSCATTGWLLSAIAVLAGLGFTGFRGTAAFIYEGAIDIGLLLVLVVLSA
jgi:hypothetical protein